MNQHEYHNALVENTELHWYRIIDVLGQGAFGITYLAEDINLNRHVAIKEYMPGAFAIRMENLEIQPISSELNNDYQTGLERFLKEARILTQFKHPNLVEVFNIFEQNNTAYMVMSFEQGRNLNQILKTRKSLGEKDLLRILVPLMDGLEMIHDKGFIHRDIKPGNIFIRKDNSPVLLDFGSARQTYSYPPTDNQESQIKTLTNFVSPGYTPIEQYSGKSDRQGPWTDIYSLGATLYKCITGSMPTEAVERSESIVHVSKDEYIGLSETFKDKYSTHFLNAIDHALQFKSHDRPQSIKEWRAEFNISMDEFDTIELFDDYAAEIGSASDGQTQPLEVTTIKNDPLETKEPTTVILAEDQHKKKNTSSRSNKYYLALASTFLFIFTLNFIPFKPATSIINNEDMTVIEKLDSADNTLAKNNSSIITIKEDTPQNTTVEPEKEVELDEKKITQEKINELLVLAAEDIQNNRFTLPEKNNALYRYKEVLALDSENKQAKNGILLLTDKFMIAAYRAIEEERFSRAEFNIAKAEEISPELAAIKKAKEHLYKKRQQVATEQASINRQAIPITKNNTNRKIPVAKPNNEVTPNEDVKIVDLSRDIPENEKNSVPDNGIDRTIKSIQTLFK